MFEILYFIKIVQSTCDYTSFDQFQLRSNNFYQEHSYVRGIQYAFGVWTQFAPIRKNSYSNKSKSYFDSQRNLDGFHILNFQNDGKLQTLFYQQPIYETAYPTLMILQYTQSGVIPYKIQEGLFYYEGYWIFTYFSFNYDNKYNFASYSTGDDRFFNFLVTNRRLQAQTTNAKLEYGGQGIYNIGTNQYNMNIFLGRISIITTFQYSIIFFNNNDKAKFISFISTCSIPQACQDQVEVLFFKDPCNKNNCTHRQFHVDIPGLRHMFDFWIKRESQKVHSEKEIIFSYGGLFQNLEPFYQLVLYWRVVNQHVILLHHLDIYYLVPGELETQYNDNFLIQLYKPRSNYEQWCYLKYEFLKIGVYQYVYLSIFQSCCDIWEQYYILNFAYYQQYSNYQATLTLFTESVNGTIVPFEGLISNLRFRYCYTVDFQFGKEFNINCNALCKTCTGPTKYDCASCYDDQNRYLQSEIQQCLCQFGFQESDSLKCQKSFLNSISEYKELYKELYKEFSIIETQQLLMCKYGYFEVWKDLQFIGCIQCPYFSQSNNQIRCLNCLLDSHKWYLKPICNIDYQSNGSDQYFYEQLDYLSQELFIIHIDLMVTELCNGCEKIVEVKSQHSIIKFVNSQKILFQCKSFLYVNNNSCQFCDQNCLNCKENGECMQCDEALYLKNGKCNLCPEECTFCNLNTEIDIIQCKYCKKGYTLINYNCIKCGYLCDDCEQRINKKTGLNYNKCLKCSFNTYISLDGESCYFNTLEHCIYPFQFSIVDNSINTILVDFQPEEIENIKSGCTYCSSISYLTPTDNIFTCTPQGIDEIKDGCYQILNLSGYMDCSIGINNLMDVGFSYCTQFIPHCFACIRLNWEYGNVCYLCDDGYYNDYYTSFCKKCDPECALCIQTDSSKIVKSSILKIISIINDFQGLLHYQQLTQNPNNKEINIICTKCADGYVQYQNKCIQKCPIYCKECKIQNDQHICISCIQFQNSYYQIYNGTCIQCPSNCKSCYPRQYEEKTQINPYFQNYDFDYFSNKCITSSSNDLYFDQDIHQFIQCEKFKEGCQNYIEINLYIYCNQIDLDNYINSLDQNQQDIQRKFHILLQNINLSLYEYHEYQLYLNQNFIKKFTYQFKFVENQTCNLNKDLFIQSNLQTNCFNLIELNLYINGANSNVILNNLLHISNFTHITIQNFNIHIQDGRIELNNIKCYSIKFQTINLIQNQIENKLFDNLILIQESCELVILNFSIYNLNLHSQNGLFLFTNKFSTSSLIIISFTIKQSQFYNTYTFNFQTKQLLTVDIKNLFIQNSKFEKTILLNQSYENKKIKIENFIFQNSNIINTFSFLNFQSTQLVEIIKIQILASILQDSIFLSSSKILNLREFGFQDLNLQGQSTLITNSNLINFEEISIQNGYFKDNVYSNKNAFILLLNLQSVLLESVEIINNSIINQNQKDSFIKNIELSTINIQSIKVTFDKLLIQRGIGFSEFTIKNTKTFQLLNSAITLYEKYQFKSLFNNHECNLTSLNQFLYNNLINFQDVSQIYFENTNVSNLILYDSVLFEVQEISQQQSDIIILNCNFYSNILHQINKYQKISLISINSNFDLNLNITQVKFSENLQNLQKESNPKKQSLILIVEASQSQTFLINCIIENNMNLNGLGSMLYVDSDQIVIENSRFFSNSVFLYDTLKQFLRWGLNQEIHLENLQRLYVISSSGGNGNLQCRSILLKNIHLANSISKYGAAFVFNMVENGIIQIVNSTFENLESDLIESIQGGAFHISSQSSYLGIKVTNTKFMNISTRKAGSIFYIVPSKIQVSVSIYYSTLQDIFSIQGGLIYVEKSIHQIFFFEMLSCFLTQNQQNFIKYINSLPDLSNNELDILTLEYSFIYCYDCQIKIKDFSISNYIFIPLFQFYGNINLLNILISDTIFSNRLLQFSTLKESDQIILHKLELKNCTQMTVTDKIPQQQKGNQLIKKLLVTSCSHNLIDAPQSVGSYFEIFSNFNEINLLQKLFDSILQSTTAMVLFTGFEFQNKIKLFQVILQNNDCNYCLNGLLNFKISQKSVIIIEQITVQNSKCGINGCISFLSFQSQRILQNQDFYNSLEKSNIPIQISQLLCKNNQAQNGGCLYIQNQKIQLISSLIYGNKAQYGGAIFTTGNTSTLISKDLTIINNTAKFGSGIYNQNNLNRNIQGLKLIDNKGLNQIVEYPQQIYLEILKNKMFIPTITQQTSNLQIAEIMAENGQRIIINVPTGIPLAQYKKFEIVKNKYNSQTMEMNLYGINSQLEIVQNLTNTYCELSIKNINSELGKKQNLRLNKYKFYFNQSTNSYNLNDLVFLIPQDLNQTFELSIQCNSIYVPIVNKINKFIEGYHQNYILKLLIKSYECQLGEYSQNSQDYCHQCNVDQKQYSVTIGATYCQIIDDRKIQEITQAQIFLRQGYWRISVTTSQIDFCLNRYQNCIGGWGVGNDLCQKGYIGALCEQCDYYNIRGDGGYQRIHQFQCQFCEAQSLQQLINLTITLIIFFVLYLIINYLAQKRLQRIRQNLTQFKGSFNLYYSKQNEILIGQSIKIILIYFQIISLTQELNSTFSDGIQQLINYLGNPFTLLGVFKDCQLLDLGINVIYLQILQNFLCLLIIITLFVCICFCMIFFFKQKITQMAFFNFTYLLYIFIVGSFIRSMFQLIGFRNIQNVYWIYKNVTYNYWNINHLRLVFLCFLPIIVGLGIVLPTSLLQKLKRGLFLKNRVPFKDFGFWFTSYQIKRYQWEIYKLFISYGMICIVIMIDANTTLRGSISYALLICYTKLFQDYQVYNNKNMNRFENKLNILSIIILISCTLLSIDENKNSIFNDIIIIFMNVIFSFGFVFMILHFWQLNSSSIKIVLCEIFQELGQYFDIFNRFNIFKLHSKASIQQQQRRFELLKEFLKQKSKEQIIIKKEFQDSNESFRY
ncbi:unnamed protein product [Paramecium sonneborni]|uniref:Transmembrane protein n=1 Tax=Paramecium sonneborni TaxID=65129 RepID=A0A8S1R287_9CILI|nr:unnamed protein product [Paramecium sonneborni]